MSESETQSVSCRDLNLAIDTRRAVIQSITSRGQSMMIGQYAYVAVEDRTTGKFHFKPEQAISAERLRDEDVVFTQADPAGDMVLSQRFSARDGRIEWSVELTTQSSDIREVHLHFVLPIFGPFSFSHQSAGILISTYVFGFAACAFFKWAIEYQRVIPNCKRNSTEHHEQA